MRAVRGLGPLTQSVGGKIGIGVQSTNIHFVLSLDTPGGVWFETNRASLFDACDTRVVGSPQGIKDFLGEQLFHDIHVDGDLAKLRQLLSLMHMEPDPYYFPKLSPWEGEATSPS